MRASNASLATHYLTYRVKFVLRLFLIVLIVLLRFLAMLVMFASMDTLLIVQQRAVDVLM